MDGLELAAEVGELNCVADQNNPYLPNGFCNSLNSLNKLRK